MAFAPLTRQTIGSLVLTIGLALGLSACAGGSGNDSRYPEQTGGGERYDPFGRDGEEHEQPGLFGPGGFDFGFGGDGGSSGAPAGIGVNSFLWRASLDTVSFMPLQTTDPFGGVIISDWYQTPESPNERFKLSVFILDRELRADGVRVNAFRQERSGAEWADAEIDPEIPMQIENAILTRARQLRVQTLGN